MPRPSSPQGRPPRAVSAPASAPSLSHAHPHTHPHPPTPAAAAPTAAEHLPTTPDDAPIPADTHRARHILHIDMLYPDHAARTESEEHRAVRDELIFRRKFGCWICGRTIDDWPEGADDTLEVHHLFAEYAEFLQIDPHRVQMGHPIFDLYNTEGEYTTADSKCGSLVLCALHHRGRKARYRSLQEGIHYSDVATWIMQRFIKDTALHKYFPGVIVVRKGVSDEDGYLSSFLDKHPEIEEELLALHLPTRGRRLWKERRAHSATPPTPEDPRPSRSLSPKPLVSVTTPISASKPTPTPKLSTSSPAAPAAARSQRRRRPAAKRPAANVAG